MFNRVDHIGVAVEDIDASLELYERDYGMTLVHRETVAEQGVEAALLDVGENHIELLTGQRGKLEEFAQALLENEVLERPDIDRIMDGVPRMQRSSSHQGLRVVAAAAPGAQADPRIARGPVPWPGV